MSQHKATFRNITWRKHWWLLINATWRPIAVCLLSSFAVLFLSRVVPFDALPIWLTAALLLVPLGLSGKVLWEIVDWRNDTYTLTESRIIDVQKTPLFGSRKQREIRLDRIQTVSVEQPDRIMVLLHYGTLVVEAAGNRPEFWHGLPQPYRVRAAILAAEDAYILSRQEEVRRQTQQDTLETMLTWIEQERVQ